MDTCWRKAITRRMEERGESWSDVEGHTFASEVDMDTEFDSGFGIEEGEPFTLWTRNHVCFPAMYDGAEWCAVVPRNPTIVKGASVEMSPATKHVGG